MDSFKKKILVTGSEGYIGKHLVRSLLKLNHSVIDCNRQVCDVRNMCKLAEEAPYQHVNIVYHLAAMTGVSSSWESPSDYYSVNTTGTQQALEFCRQVRARMVYVSACMYGPGAVTPVAEDSKPEPANPYTHSKYLGEEYCKFYADRYDVQCTIIRPFNVYGRNQSTSFLVPYIIEQVTSDSLEIWVNDLAPIRDYVYISDLIDALVSVLNRTINYEILNVGSGVGYSVSEVIDNIQEIWCTDKTIRNRDLRRKNEIMNSVADLTKIQKVTGWKPTFTLEEGLRQIHRILGP